MSVESIGRRNIRTSRVPASIADTFGLLSHDVFRGTMHTILNMVDDRAHGIRPSNSLKVYPIERGEEPLFVHTYPQGKFGNNRVKTNATQHSHDESGAITIGVDCDHLSLVFGLNEDFSSGPISDQIRRLRQARFVLATIYARDLLKTTTHTRVSCSPQDEEAKYEKDGKDWRVSAGLALVALAGGDEHYIEDVIAPFRQVLITAEDDRVETYIYFDTQSSRMNAPMPTIPRTPAWYYMGMPIIQ